MCPRIRLAVALIPAVAAAHAPVATRTLRLQLEQGRLAGLLTFHLPAAAARIYAVAGDPAVALVPRAVAGLAIEADGAPVQPKVAGATARRRPDGGIDETILLEIGPAARSIKIAVEAEPPLPVELVAQTALKLESGPGAPMRGGLSLRPRPGFPCTVTITSAGSPGTRR